MCEYFAVTKNLWPMGLWVSDVVHELREGKREMHVRFGFISNKGFGRVLFGTLAPANSGRRHLHFFLQEPYMRSHYPKGPST